MISQETFGERFSTVAHNPLGVEWHFHRGDLRLPENIDVYITIYYNSIIAIMK